MTILNIGSRRDTTIAAPPANWQTQGACRDADPELFFPTGNTPEAKAQTAEAKKVCARCPVRDVCLSWALDSGQDTGVLGGLDEEERRGLHGRLSAADSPPPAREWGTEVDERAVELYLRGEDGAVRPQERMEAVARAVRAGTSYPDLDRLHGLTRGSTSTFVSRARRVYANRGWVFPDMGPRRGGARVLSDEQVVELRERYAAGGVTDLQLALQVGVARKTVTELLSGHSYKDVGGPIRRTRENVPGESTQVMWAGRAPGFSGSKKSVEEAA